MKKVTKKALLVAAFNQAEQDKVLYTNILHAKTALLNAINAARAAKLVVEFWYDSAQGEKAPLKVFRPVQP